MKANLLVAIIGCLAIITGCIIAAVSGISAMADTLRSIPEGDAVVILTLMSIGLIMVFYGIIKELRAENKAQGMG